MTFAGGDPLTLLDSDIDLLAWQFLDSLYVENSYGNWPIDQRVEAYLRNRGMARVADDGDIVGILVGRVMSYLRIFGPRPGRDGRHHLPDTHTEDAAPNSGGAIHSDCPSMSHRG